MYWDDTDQGKHLDGSSYSDIFRIDFVLFFKVKRAKMYDSQLPLLDYTVMMQYQHVCCIFWELSVWYESISGGIAFDLQVYGHFKYMRARVIKGSQLDSSNGNYPEWPL